MSHHHTQAKRTISILLTAILLTGLSSPLRAELVDTDDISFMSKIGIQVEKTLDQKHCSVHVTADYSKFLEILPGLVGSGLVGRGKSEEEVRDKPFHAAGAWLMEVSMFTIMTVYKKNPSVNHCRFEDYLTVTNDFGNDQKHLAYSFGFDRHTFEKAHWEKMTPLNAAKIADNFTISDWLSEQVSEE